MSDQGNRTVAQVLGEITWLLTQSPTHKHLALAELEWAVMPPLLLKQFHVFYQDGQPLAFAVWAYLSEDIEKALVEHVEARQPARLDMKAWKSGDRLWLIDLVCPAATPGNKLTERLVGELTQNIFKGQRCRFVKRDEKTKVFEVGSFGSEETANA